uniref:Cystatin domain-containing protein n=1 Tax=Ananas comosus var. bracteatus TaxID=296719 RepID=A0A6V7P496_ANACO|nr:unnamed protein product [Ananas comosus var. bracteatus]
MDVLKIVFTWQRQNSKKLIPEGPLQKKLKLQEESEEMREEGKEEDTQKEDEVYVWPNGNRSRTREEWARYYKQIKESEGFDVDPFPGTCEFGLTAITDFDDEILIRCTKLAIEHFNKENDMSYVFVKIEKATCSVAAGLWYYVTFQAADSEAKSKIFQAKTQANCELVKAECYALHQAFAIQVLFGRA